MAGVPPTLLDLRRRKQAAIFNKLRKDVQYRMSSEGSHGFEETSEVIEGSNLLVPMNGEIFNLTFTSSDTIIFPEI